MKTITYQGKKYTFNDILTCADWLELKSDKPKEMQLEMIACLSIKPKLSLEKIKLLPFGFIGIFAREHPNAFNMMGE